MTPYVIINGTSSKLITGLLIQTLPPITKPKMRTSIEDIDGRDGDIITRLGYSAYDKPITIGLYGDYDVDDVITFFNQSGKITFSNELDKYYKFDMLDTIDFNKLIRFKTATFNVHVQPFKYSIEEPPITKANTLDYSVFTMDVKNKGNIYSKPKLELVGSGEITIYLNDKLLFTIELMQNEKIIIDAETMNATDIDGNFLNRRVIGDYSKFKFNAGNNIITLTGQLKSAKVENYSRWI